MIIGISGKKQSGKDLVGKIVQMLTSTDVGMSFSLDMLTTSDPIDGFLQTDYKTVRFADKLKDIVCLMTGCTREQLEDEDFKNTELDEEWNTFTYTCTTVTGLKFTNRYATWKDRNEQNHSITKYDKVFKGHTVFDGDDNVKLTYRSLLQYLGTDLLRNQLHPNVHVNMTMKDYIGDTRLESVFSKDTGHRISTRVPLQNWVIPDVRFPNEVKAIEDKDGFVIRVNRDVFCPICKCINEDDHNLHYDHFTHKARYCNDCDYIFPETEHESETALDNHKFEYTIDNNGTIKELIEQVKQILIKEEIICQ